VTWHRDLFECTLDQWDIHKLDPAYECVVQVPPKLSTISRVEIPIRLSPLPRSRSAKRKQSPEVSSAWAPRKRSTRPPLHKRSSWSSSSDSESGDERGDDDEEDEVEEMIVDDYPSLPRPKSVGARERSRRLRVQIERDRKLRRERLARADEKLKQRGGNYNENVFFIREAETPAPTMRSRTQAQSAPPPGTSKRKGSCDLPFRSNCSEN
jgi:hypothetical protein